MNNHLVELARPHQWVKNGFVLVGTVFAHAWGFEDFKVAIIAFFAFSFVSSAVYIINDMLDLSADRAHPLKCNRPIASGRVSIAKAAVLAAALLALAFCLACSIGLWAVSLISCYVLINVAYSVRLKHVVILDVFIIAAGFMLRILLGTVGLDIEPSHWLLLCGLMITLFLGFSKRRSELLLLENRGRLDKKSTRQVLEDYSPVLLEQLIGITAACTIISYALYTVTPSTAAVHGSSDLIYTLPLVAYGVFRYLFLIHHKAKGMDTSRDIFSDFHLVASAILWMGTVIYILY